MTEMDVTWNALNCWCGTFLENVHLEDWEGDSMVNCKGS